MKDIYILVDLHDICNDLFLPLICLLCVCPTHEIVWKCVVLIEFTLPQQLLVQALQLFDITEPCVVKAPWAALCLLHCHRAGESFSPFDWFFSILHLVSSHFMPALILTHCHTPAHTHLFTHGELSIRVFIN